MGTGLRWAELAWTGASKPLLLLGSTGFYRANIWPHSGALSASLDHGTYCSLVNSSSWSEKENHSPLLSKYLSLFSVFWEKVIKAHFTINWFHFRNSHLYSTSESFYLFFFWLHGLLVAACGIFPCGAQTLYLWHTGSVIGAGRLSCSVWNLSSPARDRTHVLCIARQILNHCLTREVPFFFFFFLKVLKRKHHLKINFPTFLPCHMY